MGKKLNTNNTLLSAWRNVKTLHTKIESFNGVMTLKIAGSNPAALTLLPMKSNHEDPDWLKKDVNHVFTKDVDTHRILLHFGMLGSVPSPQCDGGKCGYALYTDMSPSFFLITIRTCNCEKLKDNNYAVLLLSRLKHTVKEAFEVRDAWLKSLFKSETMNLTFLQFPDGDRN